MNMLMSLLTSIAALATAALALVTILRSRANRQAVAELIELLQRLPSRTEGRGGSGGPSRRHLSLRLLGVAVRRLPPGLPSAERERWAEEMAADLEAIPGHLRRLLFLARLWRRGAAAIPTGSAEAPRSARD
jgi:hypothetical protein